MQKKEKVKNEEKKAKKAKDQKEAKEAKEVKEEIKKPNKGLIVTNESEFIIPKYCNIFPFIPIKTLKFSFIRKRRRKS